MRPDYEIHSVLAAAGGYTLFNGYTEGIVLLLCLGTLLVYGILTHRPRVTFWIIWSITPILLFYGIRQIVPIINQRLSFHPVEQSLHRFHIPDGALALWKSESVQFRLYLPTHLTLLQNREDTRAFFSVESPVYCFVKAKHLDALRKELDTSVYVLSTYSIRNKSYVLVSQYPNPNQQLSLKQGE